MKKLLILLLFFPLVLNAACDNAKHQEYVSLAPNITYDNNYSLSSSKFNITVYNIFDGLYAKYNKKIYKPNSENEVQIDGIAQGTAVFIEIYADDGCEVLRGININEPYYNDYFGKEICNGYQDKIPQCSTQFTATKVESSTIKLAIQNYENRYNQSGKIQDEEKVEDSLFAKIRAFVKEWGIKIGLAVLTIFISSTLYNIKFRKIKHGI